MKKDYTHISMVLDRSGSMASIAKDTIGGFNTFLDDQRTAAGECTVTLVQFDSTSIDTLYEGIPVRNVVNLNAETFKPRDGTPLYDAIGQAIENTGKFLSQKPESARPAKVVFVVMTDGEENASRKFDQARVADMVKHQRQAYQWEFVFLGCNIDSYAVGGGVGVLRSHSMNMAANSAGVSAAYASAGSNLRRVRSGLKVDMSWTDEDKVAQAKAGATNP